MTNKYDQSVIVLIPAAGSSKDVFGNESTYPACLKYFQGKPIIFKIIENYVQKGLTKFKIGIRPKYESLLRNSLISFEEISIEIYLIIETKNEVDTLSQMISFAADEHSFIVNFGDTFCEFDFNSFLQNQLSVVVSESRDSENWATTKISPNGELIEINQKGVNLIEIDVRAICGVYYWKRGKDLLSLLGIGHESLVGLLQGSGILPLAISADRWIDSDHKYVFHETNILIKDSRHFNEISIDSNLGIVRKTSSNIEKLSAEVKYYESLPRDLESLFPRMFSSKFDKNSGQQLIEYFPFRTLGEVFTQENIKNLTWAKILTQLEDITFNKFARIFEIKSETEVAPIFIDKLKERIPRIRDIDSISKHFKVPDKVRINSTTYRGVDEIIFESSKVLSGIMSPNTFIHGDFCFSNILSDLDSGTLKFIDPRGGFDGPSNTGPQVYDVAKLAHSILGLYDFIVAGQFSLKRESGVSFFNVAKPENHQEIIDLFSKIYLKDRIQLNLVRLLSALTLMSIPNFHTDDEKRAEALFLHGIIEANEALDLI